MRILIVDDNEANRILAQLILEKDGHIAVTASDGEKALEECSGVKFDLILLDILMPRMNGIQTLRKLRQRNGRNVQTPVFALTAYSSPSDSRMFKQAGFAFTLSKPLSQKDVDLAWRAYQNKCTDVIPLDKVSDKKATLKHDLIDQHYWEQIEQETSLEDLISITTKFWKRADRHIVLLNENKVQASQANMQSLNVLRQNAHVLKGSSTMLALKRLETISSNLQNAAPEYILPLVDDIQKCAKESKRNQLTKLKVLISKHGS